MRSPEPAHYLNDTFLILTVRHSSVWSVLLLGISIVRVGVAWLLGLCGPRSVLWLSIVVAGPGLLGVVDGRRLREHLPARYVERLVQLLLSMIGARLVLSSVGLL